MKKIWKQRYQIIEELGRGASIRGEALSLEEFAKLTNIIHKYLQDILRFLCY